MSTIKRTEGVRTYADGFGNWHAVVPVSMGTEHERWDMAHAAIGYELTSRGECTSDYASKLWISTEDRVDFYESR